MQRAKRALALALVFALVASFCVTGAAAVDEPVPGDETSYVQNGASVTQDDVIVSKTAKRTGDNAYNITLEVTIPDNVTVPGTDTDVVLVIDSSGSMGSSGMSDAKEAAQDFANELFNATDVDIRVAIVDYDDNADVVEIDGESWLTTRQAVNRALDRIDSGGGTHIQGGIHEARELLASSDNKKVMIVISDGEPTYSFRPTSVSGTITGCYYEWFGYGEHNISNAKVEGESLEFDGFVYNYNRYADNREHRDGGTLGSGGTGSTASWDISWTCEHEGQSGMDKFSYSHAWPTIAEAGFAKADNVEIYSVYIGSLSGNAETTMVGIASGTDHCVSTEDADLSTLLRNIAGSVTETEAGAVTDPMGDNITLGDVSGLADDGVTVSADGRTLNWNPTQSQGQHVKGGTKYTVTYPITVNGNALDESDWVDANGTTTFTYEVNGVERTVNFNVPQVWGEKPVTPPQGTPQSVYVYVEVVKDDGNEFSEDEIAKLGLAAINEHGYYTIGVVNNVTMPDLNSTDTSNIIEEYGSGVITKINNREITRYAPNAGCDLSKVEWYSLHKVTNGADDYDVTGNCWHLDGRIKISDIEEVTVTYTSGYGNNTTLATYGTIKGTYTPTMSSEPTRNGYTFTGWKKVVNGEPSGNILSSEDIAGTPLTEDTTYVAQWSLNTNEVYIKVYLDGVDDTENYTKYLSDLSYTGTTTGFGTVRYDSTEDHIIVPYAYEDIDSADVTFGVNSGYVLQGVSGEFVYGSSGWGGVKIENGTWTVDNVDGGSTLNIYLNTAYKVAYSVPSGTAPTDDNTYIVGESVSATSNPDFCDTNDDSPLEERNVGKQGSWKNPDTKIKTEITIATLPDGTTGWYNENNTQYTQTTLAVSDAAAANSGYDTDSDNTFTFSATANEYTVTYDANGGSGTMTDANSPYTYGATVTVLENGFEREGYEFTEWNTQADGKGTTYQPNGTFEIEEDTILYAQWKEITGTLTVTKTFEGLDDGVLPEGFQITVTGEDYEQTFGLDSATLGEGSYTWTIEGRALGTYTVTESNYDVGDYTVDVEDSITFAEATLTEGETVAATAELKNVYVKDAPGLGVEKTVYSVNGDTEAIPEMVKVDDVIVYQIVVKNTGNVALTNISVTDTLGDQTLTVYTDADCKIEAATFDLDVNETKELYATYTVQAADAGTTLTNTATATSGTTTGSDTETVTVTQQYKVEVVYHYDTVDGPTFTPPLGTQTVFTYNAGEDWDIGTVPEKVSNNAENYIFDESRSDDTSGENISENVTVNLVYVKDEWKDGDPDGKDDDEGGDGIPDYRQARIVYEVAEGQGQMGGVSPAIDVVTLNPVDDTYKDFVTAESTATANTGYVFESWAGNDYSPEVQTNVLSHEFTAVGGETYTYTASFRAGNTDAEVTKTLVSYTRGDETVEEIPADFKARVGDVLNYAITIENTGEIALEDVTVSDSLWDEGKVETALVGGTETNVTSGSCKVDVASGSSVTITYSYTVQTDDIGRTITNTATVDMGDEEPGDDPKADEEVEVDDYSVTITPADIVAYTGGNGYSAVVGAEDQYINNSTSGLPEPGYHVVLSDAVVDWLNDNGVAAGDGLTDDAADLAGVLSFTYDDGTNERNWSLLYVGVYSYNASGSPSAYVYSIVTETAGAPSVSLKYFDDLDGDGVADDKEVITSDDIMMSADQVNHTYKMTIEGGGLDQSQVKAVLKAGESSLTTDIEIGIGELTVLSTTNEETTNSIAGSAAGVDSGVITAVGNDSITYYVNESGVEFNDEDLVSRVQLLIDEVTNETSGEFETAMAEAAFDAISADLSNAEYEMCYMDLVDTENGNAKVTFSGGELSIYWPLPDGASASDSFYIVHFTELDREHAAVGTDVLDTTNKDVIAGEVMRIGGEYYVTFDVGSFSPFVLVYGDEGGGRPIIPVPDPDDGDDEEEEFVPKWLNIDDHYAYIIGYEDGTVRPQGNITRAEVATIFFRLLTDEVREEYWSTESGYSDVSSSDWYNNAISTLSNLGVITGYEDGTFRPNASISRAEFVTIATRFFDYTAEYEGTFSDVSYSSWYADFVQAAVDMGLVNGYENGTFRPNASITRAEAVAIVNRVLLRRPDAEHLLSWAVMNTFSDNADTAAWYYADIQEATNSHDYDWITCSGERIEDWTEKLEERDWAALEREWSSAYDAPGGEVTG